MKQLFAIFLLSGLAAFSACRSSSSENRAENSPWTHRGISYSNSADYLEAIERDKFTRYFPPDASLADFRAFDDRRLGLYYFHYLRARQPDLPELSSFTQADLEKVLAERGLTAEHFEAIAQGRLQKGMPAAALFAAWGPPLESYRSQTREGETIQHIYLDEYGQQISIFAQNNRIVFH